MFQFFVLIVGCSVLWFFMNYKVSIKIKFKKEEEDE